MREWTCKRERKEMIPMEQNGYVGFFNGQQHEFYAKSLYAAKQAAVAHFKPAKSKAHMVHVHLAEKGGQPVVQTAVN